MHEVAFMGRIYANAILTIAAKDSASCFDGCFGERNWKSSGLVPLDLGLPAGTEEKKSRVLDRVKNTRTSNVNRLMAIPRHRVSSEGYTRAVLETCGWTLQEELLSRRMINCWKNQLSWTCLEATCSECITEEDHTRSHNKWGYAVKCVLVTGFSGYGCLNRIDIDKLFEHWLSIVEDFSRRRLSKASDKLIALAGIQDAIAALLDDTPVAGIWRNRFFAPSLLWEVSTKDNNEVGTSICCPSWSWVSVPMPVSYIKPPFHKMHNMTYYPEVLSWNVYAPGTFDYIEGYVEVRCRLLRDCDLPARRQIGGHDEQSSKKKSLIHSETLDDPARIVSIGEIWLMIVVTSQFVTAERYRRYGHKFEKNTALLRLERMSSDRMDFRPIGLAKTTSMDDKWQARARTETIRLF